MNGFDVGGSHKSQQTGYESFGIRNQNRVLNDGVDTTEGTGGAGFYADFFSNEEVAVSAAGGDVEMNSPGSAVVNTIKSGGNTFKMLNNLTYQHRSRSWGTTTATRAQPRAATPASRTSSSGKATPTSAARSRPTSSGSSSPTTTSRSTSRSRACRATSPPTSASSTTSSTKETWKVSQKDTVVGYYQWGRKQKPNRGLSVTRVAGGGAAAGQRLLGLQGAALARVDQPPVHRRQGQPVRLRLPARRQGRLQGAAAASRHRHQLHQRRRVGRVRPGPAEAARSPRSRPTTCRQAMGSHDLKVGFEYLLDIAKYAIDGRSGPIQYRDLNGATDRDPLRRRRRATPTSATTGRGSNDRDQRYSGYFAGPLEPEQPRRPSPPASAGITSVRTTWTASAIR